MSKSFNQATAWLLAIFLSSGIFGAILVLGFQPMLASKPHKRSDSPSSQESDSHEKTSSKDHETVTKKSHSDQDSGKQGHDIPSKAKNENGEIELKADSFQNEENKDHSP